MNKKHPLNYEEFCEHVIKQIMAGRLSLDLFRDKLSLEEYEELKKYGHCRAYRKNNYRKKLYWTCLLTIC